MADTPNCAIVVGAGDGTGAELARLLAREGYAVVLARREVGALALLVADIEAAGGQAMGMGCDAGDEASVTALFDAAEARFGPPRLVAFTTAGFAMGPVVDTAAHVFDSLWLASARGGFLVGREAVRRMLPEGQGSILFTGATASIKQGANFAAFAAGKHGLRAVAGALAREVGPQGIHVAHIIIDGVIDVPRVHREVPAMATAKGPDGLINPRHLAETLYWLHRQPPDAWTFELDIRPYNEPW